MSAFQVVFEVCMAIFALGAIPFALKVVAELSGIRAELTALGWQAEAIKKIEDRQQAVEIRLAQHFGKPE